MGGMLMQVRKATIGDAAGVFTLYQRVANIPGGLARQKQEITDDYIVEFLTKSLESGLSLVAIDKEVVIAEVHAYSPNLFCFKHLLSDLTIAVAPDYQGFGIGRKLFHSYMDIIGREYLHILRVELIARESNAKAIKFYESLGFIVEGRMLSRIRNQDETFEADIPMAWLRHNNL